MSDPQEKRARDKGELSKSAKKHLVDIYVSTRYNRRDEIVTDAIEKGTHVEEQSITIYSAFKRDFFVKNEEHLSNGYIKGTPDIRVKGKRHIIDIKSSWDAFTFYTNLLKEPESIYRWQVQGYMWLDDAVTATIAHCLVDTPEFIIEQACNRLRYEVPPSELEEAQMLLRKQMTFSDIHYRERVIEHTIERHQGDIDKIKAKVTKGRQYLKHIDECVKKNILLTELE